MKPPLTGTPVTRTDLERDLRRLGVAAGDTLIVHSSLKSIGWVIGGARAVVAALLSVLSPTGTLVMPAQSGDNSEPAYWVAPPVPRDWWPLIREHTPAFDPDRTPLRRMGAIADCFWHEPGVRRSNHPLDSFIALGPQAEAIIACQPLEAGLGEQSPTQVLYDLDAKVLLLGVDYDRCTVMHLAEYRERSRLRVPQGVAVLVDGQRVWREFMDIDLDSDDFLEPGRQLETAGNVLRGRVGQADSRLFNVRDAVDEAGRWLAEHRHHRIRPEEKPAILATLKQSPVENLFAIGDLENFDLEADFFDALALYRPGQTQVLDSLVIRYHQNLILACPGESCQIEPLSALTSHLSIKIISGRTALLDALKPHRPDFNFRSMFLLAVNRQQFTPFTTATGMAEALNAYEPPRLATLDDIPAIAALFAGIAEFAHSANQQERIRELSTAMGSGSCHYYVQCDGDQRIIGTVGTTAENSVSAMIVGVSTAPEHRGRGLASRLVSMVCDRVLGSRFQTLALFYDNPDAGRIYRRLGFADAGAWTMAERNEEGDLSHA
jgi:aminoglycoside 3-N-acetyltransferase